MNGLQLSLGRSEVRFIYRMLLKVPRETLSKWDGHLLEGNIQTLERMLRANPYKDAYGQPIFPDRVKDAAASQASLVTRPDDRRDGSGK